MATLKSKLREALKAEFPGSEIAIKNSTLAGKVGGSVIWKGFVGKDQIDRQRMIRAALAEHLTEDERQKLSAVFAMTPEEVAVMNEA